MDDELDDEVVVVGALEGLVEGLHQDGVVMDHSVFVCVLEVHWSDITWNFVGNAKLLLRFADALILLRVVDFQYLACSFLQVLEGLRDVIASVYSIFYGKLSLQHFLWLRHEKSLPFVVYFFIN